MVLITRMHDCRRLRVQTLKHSTKSTLSNGPSSSGAADRGPDPSSALPSLTDIPKRMLAALRGRAPLGYEDESGFHFGAIKPKSDSAPPSFYPDSTEC